MNITFKIDLNNPDRVPADLTAGLKSVMQTLPHRFQTGAGTIPLKFTKPATDNTVGLQVTGNTDGLTVHYRTLTDAFRALGRLLGADSNDSATLNFTETAAFDTMGLMLDVSRNGVYKPGTLEEFMTRSALMGLNMLMLYTEDTYEVPGEPFFGYLRGRYTQAELRALDKYAAALGIELVPCIQTLGHLEQILQWPAYAAFRDTEKVMLAEQPETYELLEKIIAAAATPFASKRIHIGMDEAHGIGTGQYRKQFGEKSPFNILNEHLGRVNDICRKHGLRPMIWSDMYFRLGSKTNSYYDPETVIPQAVADSIPRDISLVYWDYYHHDPAFYEDWIDRHRALGSEPLMAGGIYTWDRFWTALPWTFSVTEACLQACKNRQLREVFLTMWGDDGAEHNLFSALPGMQFFAEHAYAEKFDPHLMHANFRGICEADFDEFTRASELDSPAYLRKDTAYGTASNLSKALLWQDPLLAILDPQITDPEKLTQHYQDLAAALDQAAGTGANNTHLRQPALLARILTLKINLRRNLASAYQAGDRAAIRAIADTDLPKLRDLTAKLWRMHRAYWMQYCKPFGWETVERRYGGLLARLDGVAQRLTDYLDGNIDAIPELEENLEPIWPELAERICVRHPRLATPSFIK